MNVISKVLAGEFGEIKIKDPDENTSESPWDSSPLQAVTAGLCLSGGLPQDPRRLIPEWNQTFKSNVSCMPRDTSLGHWTGFENGLWSQTTTRVLWVRALAKVISLCSLIALLRKCTFIVPLFTQLYELLPEKELMRLALRWTSTLSVESGKTRDEGLP